MIIFLPCSVEIPRIEMDIKKTKANIEFYRIWAQGKLKLLFLSPCHPQFPLAQMLMNFKCT